MSTSKPVRTSDASGGWMRHAAVCAALIAAVVLVYAPVRHFGFLRWDDQMYVTENPQVLGGLNWASVQWAFTGGLKPYWQPVTWLSHQLDVTVFGTAAGGHHLVNLALHALNTLLLFEFFRRATHAFWRSAFVAAVFAVHPLHVESVAWVAERKDVLSTCLLSLTLLVYITYVRLSGRIRTVAYVGLAAAFVLALMAKPMVVTLPLLLILLDVWPLRRVRLDDRRGWAPVLWEKVPLVGLASVVSIITFLTQRTAGALADLQAIPWKVRLSTALTSYVIYIGEALWPVGLAAFYPHVWNAPWYVPAAAFAVLVVVTAGAVRVRQQQPFVLVGWLWYLISLLPVIGLIQAGEQAHADRFMYIPLVGLSIIVAWGVPVMLERSLTAGVGRSMRRAVGAAAVAALVALAVAARSQVMIWSDDVDLWQHTASATDRNYLAYDLLGLAHRDRGQWDQALENYAIARQYAPQTMSDFTALVDYNMGFALVKQGRIPQALDKFASALALKPNLFEAENDMGAALMLQGRATDALPHFSRALAMHPEFAEAANGLGAAQDLLGDHAAAESAYRRAIALDPKMAVAHANLAMVLVRTQRREEAIDQLQAALALEPKHADWRFNAGALFAGTGRIDEAVAEWEAALAVDPKFERARMALNQVAVHHH